jgi:hypothetical protein
MHLELSVAQSTDRLTLYECINAEVGHFRYNKRAL